MSLSDYAGSTLVLYVSSSDDAWMYDAGLRLPRFLEALSAAGVKVVGISPDKPEKLAPIRERTATFPLLSDPDHQDPGGPMAPGEKNPTARSTWGTIRFNVRHRP